MKQKYIKPTTAIVKLRLNKFICLSRFDTPASSTGEVLSRRNRYWDDEEDEFDF